MDEMSSDTDSGEQTEEEQEVVPEKRAKENELVWGCKFGAPILCYINNLIFYTKCNIDLRTKYNWFMLYF